MAKRSTKPSGNQRPTKPVVDAKRRLHDSAGQALQHISANSTPAQVERRMQGVNKPATPASRDFGKGAAFEQKSIAAAQRFVRNGPGGSGTKKVRNRSEAARKAAITRKAKGK